MAEETNGSPLKLKVDPKALQQLKSEKAKADVQVRTAVPSDEEINGKTVSLKQETEVKTLSIEPLVPEIPSNSSGTATPMPLPIGNEKSSKLPRGKQRKSSLSTAAEREYRRHLIISILVVLLIIVLAAAALCGGISVYLIGKIIDNPVHGQTIHQAASDYRKADGISQKFSIISKAIDSIAGGAASTAGSSDDTETETYSGSGYSSGGGSPGTFTRIRQRTESTVREVQNKH